MIRKKPAPDVVRGGSRLPKRSSFAKELERKMLRSERSRAGPLDTWFTGRQQGAPSSLGTATQGAALLFEHGARDPVARRDTELARSAADDFQHRADRPAGWNQAIRQRLGI